MPYAGELIHEDTGFLWIGQGVLTGQELIEGSEVQVRLAPAPGRITHSLVDFTQVTAVEVTVDEVMQVGEIDRRNAEVLRCLHVAIVVPTHHGHSLASIYEHLTSPKDWTTRTFPTRAEAETWLASVLASKG